MEQHSQYSDYDIHWKIWGSNLGRSKRTISPPKNPDQLQCPPSFQLNENHSFFSGSEVARADSLTTIMSRDKFTNQWSYTSTQPVCLHGTAGQLYFTSTSYLCTSLSTSHILSDLIKELFYTLLSLTCTLHDPFISFSLIQLH